MRSQALLFPALFQELEGDGSDELLPPLLTQLVRRLAQGPLHDSDRAGEELLVFSSDAEERGGARDGAEVSRFRVVGAQSGHRYGGLEITHRDRSRSSDQGREITALLLKYGLNGRLTLAEGEALAQLFALPSEATGGRSEEEAAQISARGRELARAFEQLVAERRAQEEQAEGKRLKLLELLAERREGEGSAVFVWLHEQLAADPIADCERAGEELRVCADVFRPRPEAEVTVFGVLGAESGRRYATVTLSALGDFAHDDGQARREAEARALLLECDLNGRSLSIPERDRLHALLDYPGWHCAFCEARFQGFAEAEAHELEEHGQTSPPREL